MRVFGKKGKEKVNLFIFMSFILIPKQNGKKFREKHRYFTRDNTTCFRASKKFT